MRVVNVFNPKHATIVSNDDSRGKIDPFLEFDAKEDGLHTVRIYDHLRGGGPTYGYRIEVTTPTPSVDLVLKELRRDESQVVCVPIGGSGAMVVTGQRNRYNGEVNLTLDGLPKGVTATTFPMPPGRPEVPVLLTAAADATHNASLYTITAKGDAKNPLVGGSLSQTHKLVSRPKSSLDVGIQNRTGGNGGHRSGSIYRRSRPAENADRSKR